MRRWLRRHHMTWLVHPVRVQRVSDRQRQRRAKRRRASRAQRPCCRCGYEMLGLPSLTCPECGTTHEAAWYEGRLKAGGRWRNMAIAACVGGSWMGFQMGASIVFSAWLMFRFARSGPMQVPVPAGTVPSGVVGAVSLVCSIVVGWWVWRVRRRLMWGPPRSLIVALELGVVCALLGWLAWSLLRVGLPWV